MNKNIEVTLMSGRRITVDRTCLLAKKDVLSVEMKTDIYSYNWEDDEYIEIVLLEELA